MSTCTDHRSESDNFVYIPSTKISIKEGVGRPASNLEIWHGLEHVLLIDDEDSLVNVTKSMLEHLGYTVTAYTSTQECLKSFPEEMSRYSLIISDHLMPEINGMDLLAELRKLHPHIPVVLCTGHADPDVKSKLQRMGCSGLVTKPYTLPQLGETVRRVLDNAATCKQEA